MCVAAVCLLSVAAALPSKLGGHGHGHGHRAVQRQARQGGAETGYLAARQEPEQPAYNGWVTIFFMDGIYFWVKNIYLMKPFSGAAAASEVVETKAAPEPIGVRSFNLEPLSYSFETENDISQQMDVEMKEVEGEDGPVEVAVMRGSYSYIGADGEEYLVEWYADETGYHPTARHLPKSVEPDHPEVAAAVRAQLAFAAEEEAAAARAAASETVSAYAAPPLSAYATTF